MKYTLIRSRRRTVSLEVTGQGAVIVRAPLRLEQGRIQRFLEDKGQWVTRKVHEVTQRLQKIAPKRFVEGEEFLYLGKKYAVRASGTDCFVFEPEAHRSPREIFIAWYRQQAETIIRQRVREYSARTGLRPLSVRIGTAKTRWGSCGCDGSLNFSWRLIMAPIEVIDYVVAHELAHIQERNHSRAFWRVVESIMPEYYSRRRWLKEHGYTLTV